MQETWALGVGPRGVAAHPPPRPCFPPPPKEQEGKCQLGFVHCSSGCRSSHLSEPTQLLIGRPAGSGGGGLGTASVARDGPVTAQFEDPRWWDGRENSLPGSGEWRQLPSSLVTIIEIWVFPCTQAQGRLPLPGPPGMGSRPCLLPE